MTLPADQRLNVIHYLIVRHRRFSISQIFLNPGAEPSIVEQQDLPSVQNWLFFPLLWFSSFHLHGRAALRYAPFAALRVVVHSRLSFIPSSM